MTEKSKQILHELMTRPEITEDLEQQIVTAMCGSIIGLRALLDMDVLFDLRAKIARKVFDSFINLGFDRAEAMALTMQQMSQMTMAPSRTE